MSSMILHKHLLHFYGIHGNIFFLLLMLVTCVSFLFFLEYFYLVNFHI